MEDKGKIIVSVQMDKEMFEELKQIAIEDCSSVSYLIRRGVLKTIREYREGDRK